MGALLLIAAAVAAPAAPAIDPRCGTTIVLAGDLGPLWRPWANCPADKPVRYDAWAAQAKSAYIVNARGMVVEGLTVDSTNLIGVQIVSSSDLLFVGTRVAHVGFGFFGAKSERIKITYSRVVDVGSDCFNLNTVDTVLIADNVCRVPALGDGAHPDGVQIVQRAGIDPASTNVTVERNVFIGAMQGVFTMGTQGVVVRDNVIRVRFKNAILVNGATDAIVTGNLVSADVGAVAVPTITAAGPRVCGNRGPAAWGAQGLAACSGN